MNMNEGYRKRYKLRIAATGKKTIEVTFPYEVVEKEARVRQLSIDDFLVQFHAIAEYDNFDGVHYTFAETNESQKPS